jgi:hypothetical protein
MATKWYPSTVKVGPEGTPGTYAFMKECFGPDAPFNYAELGVYQADTTKNIAELFPNSTLYLFDFHDAVAAATIKLQHFPNKIFTFGNTQLFNDSYNWSLLKLIQDNDGRPIFDYIFLDGAHTFSVDALSFFLCDRLLKPGGYLDFDDYNWRLRGSSLDPMKIPEIADQYTDEQIDAFQVKLIVDELVKRTDTYQEVITNKIFRKI